MALTYEPEVRRRSARGPRRWPLLVAGVLGTAVILVLATADRGRETSASSARGSGVSVTERREVAPFTSVELAGTNSVVIHVGAPPSVVVTGDDNLVGRVTTMVRAGRLVIGDSGSFTTRAPMYVSVSVPSLDGVELADTGSVTVDGVTSADFGAQLTGDGALVVSGTVQRLTAVLTGDGTLDLHDLVAADVTAHLEGTGTIRIHANSTLDATLSGTGMILYRGDPMVTMRNTGTGMVTPE